MNGGDASICELSGEESNPQVVVGVALGNVATTHDRFISAHGGEFAAAQVAEVSFISTALVLSSA